MSKYDSLSGYLAGQSANTVTLQFSKLSEMIPGGLPQSAYDHRPWWANRHDGKDAQNIGWQSVGWETKDVDMRHQLVTFVRVAKVRAEIIADPHVRPLTIEEAKQGLAAKFGVDPSCISISISA